MSPVNRILTLHRSPALEPKRSADAISTARRADCLQIPYEPARKISAPRTVNSFRNITFEPCIDEWHARCKRRLRATDRRPGSSRELLGHVRGALTGAICDAPGKIAAAVGGTLFLDEVADLPLALQPKLLRFLQERKYERVGEAITYGSQVRIVAATHRDLEAEVATRSFREDLLYRLNVIELTLPPLRHRTDIAVLADHLLAFFARQSGCQVIRTGCTPARASAQTPPPTPPSQGGEAVRGQGDPLTPPLAKGALSLAPLRKRGLSYSPPCEGGVGGVYCWRLWRPTLSIGRIAIPSRARSTIGRRARQWDATALQSYPNDSLVLTDIARCLAWSLR